MIKWPEPYVTLKLSDGNWVETGGDPEVRLTVYSEAQLKQAVRDAVEACARVADCRDLPATSAAIRALIKELDA